MNARIVENSLWAAKAGVITLESKEFTELYIPGQMCMLQTSDSGTFDPILKRPFAPLAVNKENGQFQIMYAVVGRGTELLSRKKEGTLSVSTPHGKPFTLLKNKKVALIAGGVGFAPMFCLSEALYKSGCDVSLYYGARNAELLCPAVKNRKLPYETILCTDDGSYGNKGYAVEYLEKNIAAYDMCYTTGPDIMMRAVAKVCKNAGKPLEVSLEETMACGIGVCGGCMVKVEKKGVAQMKRCCTEGPVFNAMEVY